MAFTKEEKIRIINKRQEKVNFIFKDIDCGKVIEKALNITSDNIIDIITDSGLKGRGGAGFPTGDKWRLAADEKKEAVYIICNADESEPGTFKDRQILEDQAEKVFTGMTLCALATGSTEGFIYSDYNGF